MLDEFIEACTYDRQAEQSFNKKKKKQKSIVDYYFKVINANLSISYDGPQNTGKKLKEASLLESSSLKFGGDLRSLEGTHYYRAKYTYTKRLITITASYRSFSHSSTGVFTSLPLGTDEEQAKQSLTRKNNQYMQGIMKQFSYLEFVFFRGFTCSAS